MEKYVKQMCILTVVWLLTNLTTGYGHEGSQFNQRRSNHWWIPHPIENLHQRGLYNFQKPPQKNQANVQTFEIWLKRTDLSTSMRSRQYSNDIYAYQAGSSIDLTCFYNKKTDLEWTDDDSFTTGKCQIDENSAIRIKITPDKYDKNVTFICKAHSPKKNIYTQLTPFSGNSDRYPEIGEINETVKKHTFLNATCNGKLYYPGEKESFSKVTVNEKITQSFNKNDNGTFVICVKYKQINDVKDNDIPKYVIYTYVRERWKHVYIYNDTDELEEEIGEPTMTIIRAEMSEGNIGTSNVDTNSKLGIVAGSLGAVIIFLLIIIAINFFKNRRRVSTDDDTAEVIYAEIGERPTQRPPALSIHHTYEQVLGNFVPKTPQTEEEHVYCTLD